MKHPGWFASYWQDHNFIVDSFKTKRKAMRFIPPEAWDEDAPEDHALPHNPSVFDNNEWGFDWKAKRPRRLKKPKRTTPKQVLKEAPKRIEEVKNYFYQLFHKAKR